MNKYQSQLEKEYGKDYTKALMKWARKAVKISDGLTNDSKFMADWDITTSALSSDELQKYGLAILAVKAPQYKGMITINMDEFMGRMFSYKTFKSLAENGMIDFFRVSQPYQIVLI